MIQKTLHNQKTGVWSIGLIVWSGMVISANPLLFATFCKKLHTGVKTLLSAIRSVSAFNRHATPRVCLFSVAGFTS